MLEVASLRLGDPNVQRAAGGKRGAVQRGEGAGGRRVSPRAPPAVEGSANSCRLGSCEGISPGMSSCVKHAGYSCRSGSGGTVADSPELCAVVISTHSRVNSRSGFTAHNPITRSGRLLLTLAKWSEIPWLSGSCFPKCFLHPASSAPVELSPLQVLVPPPHFWWDFSYDASRSLGKSLLCGDALVERRAFVPGCVLS